MANDLLDDRPPLLEVVLQLQFDPNDAAQERLAFVDQTLPESESILIRPDLIELHNSQKVSYGRLRDHWSILLPMILNTSGIQTLNSISLSYLNEIPLQDLLNFQNYLNFSFQMPAALKDRIEFFRTEFTYRYDFGEIRVWLQPDWDDQLDGYCIQLNMESRHPGPVEVSDLLSLLDEMHSGLKDVFHQILSQDYVKNLPQ